MRPGARRMLQLLIATAVLAGAVGAGAFEVCQRREQARIQAMQLTGGDPRLGLVAIGRYGCGACHQIPGVPGASGQVGPSLKGVSTRAVLAGRLDNSPANLARWIRQPQTVEPGTAMPDLGVGEADSRDIAAYLYTLK